MKEVVPDYRLLKVNQVSKAVLRYVVWYIRIVTILVKENWQLLKEDKIIPEKIRVLLQELAVSLIVRLQFLYIWRIERLSHNAEGLILKKPRAVQFMKHCV